MIKLPALLFDPECGLCVRFTQGLRLLDRSGSISMVPITDESIYEEYSSLTFEDCSETIHLIDENGDFHRGPDVIEFLIKQIPTVSKLSWLIEKGSSKRAMGSFYDKVNEIRKNKKNAHAPGCDDCGTRRSRKVEK